LDLGHFNNPEFNRGAGKVRELLWLLVRRTFFLRSVLPAYGLRRALLRRFGACVGAGVVIKPGAKITFPWRLSIGEHSWIGEDVFVHNLDRVVIGNGVCVSQRAFLCTGNHDWSDPAFALVTRPIVVEDGAWICADVFVAPGVTIANNAVVTAGSVVTRDLPAGMICSGNPCKPVKPRR